MARVGEDSVSQRPLCHTENAREIHAQLEPITGYANMPLVSVEKAVEPLIDILPEIDRYIELYTMSWIPFEECLYFALNKTLRSPDRRKLQPWFLYLRLLLNGLFRLPPMSETIYRGVKSRSDEEEYITGQTIVWWGFSSCTRKLNVLQEEQFLGEKGARTMFMVRCHSGRDISKHSYFPWEREVLLLAATELEVLSCLKQQDLTIIELGEIRSSKPLLQPVRVVMTLDDMFFPVSKSSETSRTTSEVSVPITPKGTSKLIPYQNSRLEEDIADNRYSAELDLKSMGLTDQDMKIVADDAIRTTTTLTVLNLENNKIGPQGVHYLCDQLKYNETITTISLRCNQISDKGVQYLGAILRQSSRLTTLDLFKTHITEKGTHCLGNALRENRTLRTLNLSSNRFGALGVEHLCIALKQNTALTTLILSFNDVGDQGSQYLRDALRENTTLSTLELEHSQIKAQGVRYLYDALQQNTALTRLNLLHNPFGERGSHYLAELKRKHKRLKLAF